MPTEPNDRLKSILENTSTPISAHLSPTMHPDSVHNLGPILVDGQGGPAEAGFAAARSALRALYEVGLKIHNGQQAMLEPVNVAVGGSQPVLQMQVPAHRAAELAAAMGASAARLSAQLERSVNEVDSSIATLESRMASATTNPRKDTTSESASASEIRAYVAAMKPGERMNFLERCCQDGDHQVVTAVLDGSHWVAGLSREQVNIIRAFAHEKWASRETAQSRALRSVKQQLENASAAFGQHYARLLPKVANDPKAAALAELKKAG